MGKCFIADMRIGIWVTGDQMLFTLSHSPQVQWPSDYVHACLPLQVLKGLLALFLSQTGQTPSLSGLFSPRKWKAFLLFLFTGSAQIKSVYLCICSIAFDLTQVTATSRVTSWHSAPDLTNGNACLGICESVTPVLVRRFQSEVTSRCQRKMSLQKRFASSLKPRHRVGCLTAWCDGEEICGDFPVLLCRESVLLFGGFENLPAAIVTTITMTNSELRGRWGLMGSTSSWNYRKELLASLELNVSFSAE